MSREVGVKPEDRLIVKKAVESAFLCIKNHKPVYTDFYNPREISLIKNELKKISDVDILLFGGSENCERVIMCIAPGDTETKKSEFPIKTLYVDSSRFSGSLTHRDFLGAIIGLGIDRGKIGDIMVSDGNAIIFVHSIIAEFIVGSFDKVGSKKVSTTYCQKAEPISQQGKMIRTTVPSMRADAVVGEAFSLSRSKAKEYILAEKLYINWTVVTNPSAAVNEGDVISLRGCGRAILREKGGKTKKDRVFVEIERWL